MDVYLIFVDFQKDFPLTRASGCLDCIGQNGIEDTYNI